MNSNGILTDDGKKVMDAARKAGYELAKDGAMKSDTLELISRPLISEPELKRMYNELTRD